MKCKQCDKIFKSKQALHEHIEHKHLSADDRKVHRAKRLSAYKRKKTAGYVFGGAAALLVAYFVLTSMHIIPHSGGVVHWHMPLEFYVCGDRVALPEPLAGNSVHGKTYVGTELLHLHDDNQIHVEGVVADASDISLGQFMNVVNVEFGNDNFMGYTNGDLCGDTPGEVVVTINGETSLDPANYVLVDGDRITVSFQ